MVMVRNVEVTVSDRRNVVGIWISGNYAQNG